MNGVINLWHSYNKSVSFHFTTYSKFIVMCCTVCVVVVYESCMLAYNTAQGGNAKGGNTKAFYGNVGF